MSETVTCGNCGRKTPLSTAVDVVPLELSCPECAEVLRKLPSYENDGVQRAGYVGWVEFLRDQVSTTHIAYLHEDGSIYLPEGPQVVSEIDLRFAEAAGRMWPLVPADWLT